MLRRRGAEAAIAHADRGGREGRAGAETTAPAAAAAAAGGSAAAARDAAAAGARVGAAAGARGGTAAAAVTAASRAAAVAARLGKRRTRAEQQSRYGNRELLTESLHIMPPQRR